MLEYIFEFFAVFILILVILTTKHWLFIGSTIAILLLLGSKFYQPSLNPVGSLAHYINGEISLSELVLFISAETLGSVAAIIVYITFIKKPNLKQKK